MCHTDKPHLPTLRVPTAFGFVEALEELVGLLDCREGSTSEGSCPSEWLPLNANVAYDERSAESHFERGSTNSCSTGSRWV